MNTTQPIVRRAINIGVIAGDLWSSHDRRKADSVVGSPILVDSTRGAQVLPDIRSRNVGRINSWVASQCLSADQSTKQPLYREMAAQLVIVLGPETDDSEETR